MPFLSAYAGDPASLPVFSAVNLTADVAITPVNTSVDIVTFGTVQPGTYIVSAQVDVAQITAAAVVTLQFLLAGAIVRASEATVAVGAGLVHVASFPLVVGVAGILKLVAFSTVLTSTAKKVATNNGVGTDNMVTGATAIRIA